MKILALMTDAYGGYGGIAQYNRDMLDALVAMPEVTAIVSLPRLPSDTSCLLPTKLVEHGSTKLTIHYLWNALYLALRDKPNIILCGHINLLPLAAVLRKCLSIPLVVELYGIDVWSPHRSLFHDWYIHQVTLAISISRFTRQKFLAWALVSPAKVRVVPNAIHLDQYLPSSKPAYLQDRYGLHSSKVLLTVGRLSDSERYKGQDRVIQLMPSLLKQRPDLIYIIAGDGDDLNRLQGLARECNVPDHVRFIGRIPAGEMMDHYNLADAFVMPSTGEGFGFVFLEAAACGVPVLGGSVDGSPDALADGRIGVMVDPEDSDALLHGILCLLDRSRAVPDDLAMYDIGHFKRQIRQLILSNTAGAATSINPSVTP